MSVRYRRLPGRRMGFLKSPSCWLGDDHILLVEGTRFAETYRRVYFRDLQALVIQRKARFVMQWPYVLPLPFLLLALFGGFRTQVALPIVGAAVVAGVAVALLSIRFGCCLDLATAVGNVRVKSVTYLWTARRFAIKVSAVVTPAQQD
jgi:hypothetical protein